MKEEKLKINNIYCQSSIILLRVEVLEYIQKFKKS